jgi:hypothetical protein
VVCLVFVLSRVFCMSRGLLVLNQRQLFIVVSDWGPYLGSYIPWIVCGFLFYV